MEFKSKNDVQEIVGDFNIIITSNAILQIEFDDDVEAWQRRILWINYERPTTSKRIPDLDRKLLEEEGEGIFKWAVEGAEMLLRNGGRIIKTPEQEARVAQLIAYSKPFEIFADNYIHSSPRGTLSTSEVMAVFSRFCRKTECPLPPERKVQRQFHEYMRSKFGAVLRKDIKRNGKCNRGYVGYVIKKACNHKEN